MSTETLSGLLAQLAEARKRVKDVNADVKYEQEQWEAEVADLLDQQRQLRAEQDRLEVAVRELALNVYYETGNTKPADGLTVKHYKEFTYDPKLAYQWSLDHGLALSLDRKMFEKIAGSTDIPFVEVKSTPKVTVATNLDEALRVETEDPTPVGTV